MSFLDKLKKCMGIEKPVKKKIEEKPKKIEIKAEQIKPVVELSLAKTNGEEKVLPKKKVITLSAKTQTVNGKEKKDVKEKWFEPQGQLTIDMYQTETDLIIQSAIAGTKPERLDIAIERDIIIVRGIRAKPFEEKGDYFIQECYWGAFSREVILPVEADPDRAEASMKEGILTIRLPKILREKRRSIKIKE